MNQEAKLIVVLTTFPEEERARAAARELIESKLAACCTLVQGTSLYWWQDNLTEDKEVVMLIKTLLSLYPDLENKLREIHPYKVPEILALPVISTNKDYSDWIKEVTRN
jgi:periplasmic divalent cation tolerance protein